MIATCGVAGAVVNIKKCATFTAKGDMETSLTLFGFLLFGFLILFLGWWFQWVVVSTPDGLPLHPLDTSSSAGRPISLLRRRLRARSSLCPGRGAKGQRAPPGMMELSIRAFKCCICINYLYIIIQYIYIHWLYNIYIHMYCTIDIYIFYNVHI